MRLFNTVALEIAARCNRRCEFCPVAYNTRPDERMSRALLDKAFMELAGLDYRARIEFYIYNEPCRDWDQLMWAIVSARAYMPRAVLMIATNGDYIRDPDELFTLYGAGLNQLVINCYSPGLYERRAPWLETLAAAGVEVGGNVYGRIPPSRQTVQMLDKSDPDEFGTGYFRLTNRSGFIPEFLAPTAEPVKSMCTRPFRTLNVNWEGTALVCCNDYHGAQPLGNLRDSTLEELWNSPILNTYRARLWDRNRDQPLCDVCDCHPGPYTSNVDTDWGAEAPIGEVRANYSQPVPVELTARP